MSGVIQEVQDLLYQALSEPVGLLINVSDVRVFQTRAAAAKTQAQDPALSRVKIKMSPFAEGNVVLVVEAEAESESEPSPNTKPTTPSMEGPEFP